MTRFCTLSSGSSGNAIFLSDNKTNIIIDCGISEAKLSEQLLSLDLSPGDISYILVTHEHTDHTRGVGALSRKYDIPIVASEGTWKNMSIGNIKDKNIISFSKNTQMDLRGIGVTPFDIPHDAAQPTGYRFDTETLSLAIATDIGHITPNVSWATDGCDIVLLESNYDNKMLENGKYPRYLKNRIKGNLGHLGNDASAEFAVKLINSGTKYLILGHLSNENNTPDIAYETVLSKLKENKITPGVDAKIKVAPRFIHGDMVKV